jgi:hypothetical protein
MNVDRILETLNANRVAYVLIGGMNLLLRHQREVTYDVDFWIEDTPENLARCEQALGELGAEWGSSDADWGPVADKRPGWLGRQGVFCLNCPAGAVDIFRAVKGLESWAECRARAESCHTAAGTAFSALCDEDLLRCQLALPESEQKLQRIHFLQYRLGRQNAQ